MIEDLTPALFEKYAGQCFMVANQDGAEVKLTLVSVREHEARNRNPKGPCVESFSVFFEGPAESALPQGSYTFSHPEMGSVEHLFMVPIVNRDPAQRTYEVVFSRLAGE